MGKQSPIASIIVPTRNRAVNLAETLNSLIFQRIRTRYELLIVDNGSTDETHEVTQDAIAAYPERTIRYLKEPVLGLLSGRHRGALEARSDLLMFVDDDIEAEPDWLEAVIETFHDPTVQLVGGPSLPHYETLPPAWLKNFWIETAGGGHLCTWLSLIDLGDRDMEIDPTFVLGLNLGIRRSALFAAGGFHPDCIPDHLQHWQGDGETGLTRNARMLGFRAVYQPRALVRHRIPASRLSAEYFERRGYYQGICDSYSRIRAAARAPFEAAASAQNIPRVPSVSKYFKVPEKWGRSLVRLAWKSFVENREVADIRHRAGRAYEAGFEFHQSAACRHPEVLEWVLRTDYWNYQLPELSRPLDYE